ncbi:MMPL family transporter [Streptomyces sp. NRRL B-24572]|uniref:MMPL family transporter n=1 Tax=Streptomyces sp. NRRL B-24572 TaxID=1962156 RepID=UPI00211B47B3|nr:MMPL family transporter [Streptomyces sp. NRRL B-24572]
MAEVKKTASGGSGGSGGPGGPGGSGGGWTRFVTAHPRLTLLVALVLTALAVLAGGGVADRMGSGGWEDPAAESTYATKALERQFPGSQPNVLLLVDAGGAGTAKAGGAAAGGTALVDTPAVAAEARKLAEKLDAEPGVEGVGSYWSTGSPALRSEDGGGLAVRHEMQTVIQEDLLRAELIALPVTLVLLVMVFGSAVAALLPLGVGIVAILGTNAVLRGITEFTDVSVFAQNLTTALGLGLAIDYALFVVRRYREELAAGADTYTAVRTTLRTAGRTVLFSALTVAVSLAAMLVFPQYFLRSFAYAGIAVVLLAATAALTLLPAALVLLGDRVNALDLRRLLRRGGTPGKDAEDNGRDDAGAGWGRAAALVMRRAPVFAVVTTAGLVLLGLPFLGVKFGTADDRQLPVTASSRVVQDQLRDGFPGNPGGGITVLAEGTATPAQYADYREEIAALDGVGRAEGPVTAGGGSAYFTVVPEGETVGADAQRVVGELRATEAPFATSVTGPAAVLVDSKDAIADRLPWAAGIIVLVTLLLVFLLTGSVLIPVQAVLLNALSLTAMFGAVVWVFQEGHLAGFLGFTSTGDIETTLPVLMFCVAFGLSMDYGVFLLSRIKEEYDATGDHEHSVRFGLRHTGGLITAAAVILAVVMVAIGTSRVTNTKMLGLGVALAVLMDAMVVRSLLVPSVMKLTGRLTWWAPGPLRRFHDRFGISETDAPAGAGAGAGSGESSGERTYSAVH